MCCVEGKDCNVDIVDGTVVGETDSNLLVLLGLIDSFRKVESAAFVFQKLEAIVILLEVFRVRAMVEILQRMEPSQVFLASTRP